MAEDRARTLGGGQAVPHALAWATDIDVLPPDHTAQRRDGYIVVRSPSNPDHWWGNLLIFDDPPGDGDRQRWEAVFDAELGAVPEIRHRTFAWDRVDGALGQVNAEFVAHGYTLEQTVGLIATPDQVAAHPRENRDVEIRALAPQRDTDLWAQVLEIQVGNRTSGESLDEARRFNRQRLADLRAMFAAGRGAWYVALLGEQVVGSCGVVVTGTRGRYQSVDTALAHRRRGVSSRLVVAAGRDAAVRFGAEHLVILADPDYHALPLYESLGFRLIERVAGVIRKPPARERP